MERAERLSRKSVLVFMRASWNTPVLSLPVDPGNSSQPQDRSTHTEEDGDSRAAAGTVQGWTEVLFQGEGWSEVVGASLPRLYPGEALWPTGVAVGTGGGHRESGS